jgi:hypothetical protein
MDRSSAISSEKRASIMNISMFVTSTLLFTSWVQFVLILVMGLIVAALGIYAASLSIKFSSTNSRVMGALACATLITLILAWSRDLACENHLEGDLVFLKELQEREHTKYAGILDPPVVAGIRAEYGQEKYILILIGALGITMMGVSYLFGIPPTSSDRLHCDSKHE